MNKESGVSSEQGGSSQQGSGVLTLLPVGGFLSHTTIVLAATLKPLKLWLPNFVTSCFYLFATI